MKSRILGAALCAASSLAAAQSGVTVYGSVDAGLRNVTNVNAAGDDRLTMGSNGTFRSNRLGFSGSEDLGGGLKAVFQIEAGFNMGTGALNNTAGALFQREARVGLAGNWGAVGFGRQYTVAYDTIIAFDPFVYRYPSITYALSSTAGTRRSNDIKYTGKFGDFTVRAEYALGEVAGSVRNGSAKAIGTTYASGPLKLGAAYTRADNNVGSAASPNYRDYDHFALGGSYTFNKVTASAGYVDEQQETVGADETSKWAWAGLRYQLSPQIGLTGAWYRQKAFNNTSTATVGAGDAKRNLYMVGATYSLSKRTTLYSELDMHKLSGGYERGGTTRLNQSRQTGFSFGVMHTF